MAAVAVKQTSGAAAATGTAVCPGAPGATVSEEPAGPASAALTGRIGRPGPAVAVQDPAGSAGGLRQRAAGHPVGAAADEGPANQRLGGRVDRGEEIPLDCLQRCGVSNLGQCVLVGAGMQALHELRVKCRRLRAERLIGLRVRAEQRGHCH